MEEGRRKYNANAATVAAARVSQSGSQCHRARLDSIFRFTFSLSFPFYFDPPLAPLRVSTPETETPLRGTAEALLFEPEYLNYTYTLDEIAVLFYFSSNRR